MRTPVSLGMLLASMAVTAAPLTAQNTPETASTPSAPPAAATAAPAGITPELIAQGEKVFNGPGNCYACHGSKGEGSVGPNLTDSQWLHSKGSLEDIVAQVTNRVPKEASKTGIPMPPKGGGTISEEDVKAVSVYVYSLSHK
jgi:mono/diheme cytochrome c family protein